MRIVAALGGNALLRRGEPPEATLQLAHLAEAVRGLTPLLDDHEILLTHGNGPQIGLLAVESAGDSQLSAPYPLDALDAQTQGMIGYWLIRELRRARPERQIAALLTQTVVRADDPAFHGPTKFIGRVYPEPVDGWTMRRDGDGWRRVVPSPEPQDVVELPTIRRLLDWGCLVVAAGGGGVPIIEGPDGPQGVEGVVDKDLTASLLAERLNADALLLLTDVPAILDGYGTPGERPIGQVTPDELRALELPAGSMGPKAEAAARFAERRPGGVAVIGALREAANLLDGRSGTRVRAASGCRRPSR
jgi:carbamate kinase